MFEGLPPNPLLTMNQKKFMIRIAMAVDRANVELKLTTVEITDMMCRYAAATGVECSPKNKSAGVQFAMESFFSEMVSLCKNGGIKMMNVKEIVRGGKYADVKAREKPN